MKRKHVLLVLLLFFRTLIADEKSQYVAVVGDGEPSTNVADLVSAMSGDFFLSATDVVVGGPFPISIDRIYVSGDQEDKIKGWSFFAHTQLEDKLVNSKQRIAKVSEPNGSVLQFGFLVLSDQYSKLAITNTSKGVLSRRTNPKNHVLQIGGSKHCKYSLANGTTRYYTCHPKEDRYAPQCFYVLEKEVHPNGNVITYEYDSQRRPTWIKSLRLEGEKVVKEYGWIQCVYSNDKHCQDFTVRTSEGQELKYFFNKFGEDGKYRYHLARIERNFGPTEYFEYTKTAASKHALLTKQSLPLGRELQVEYYDKQSTQENDKIASKSDARFERAKGLYLPSGENGSAEALYTFKYLVGKSKKVYQRKTTVTDCNGCVTEFGYDDTFRPDYIKQFHPEGSLKSHLTFKWGAYPSDLFKGIQSELLEKALYDGAGALIWKRTYTYDNQGNVIKESFEGVSQERVETQYAHDKLGRIISREEPGGLVTRFTYFKETDLITSEINDFCKKFKEYNDESLLISEIEEDESGRKIVSYILGKNSMPEEILYMDGKKKLTYNLQKKVTREEVFDREGAFRYTIDKTYDLAGHLLSETTPDGYTIHYEYDVNGMLLKKLDPRTYDSHFTYDQVGRLVTEQHGTRTTHHTYDKLGHKTSTTDYLGTITQFKHDSDGYLLETTAENLTQKCTYNPLGKVTRSIDPQGYVTSTTYNARGDPTSITYPDGTSQTLAYFPDGSLKKVTDQEGNTTTYTRDFLGREVLLIKQDIHGTLLDRKETKYLGLAVVEQKDLSGDTLTYTYDPQGRKKTETLIAGEICKEKEFFYDTCGRHFQTREGDLLTTHTFDILDRPISTTLTDLNTHQRVGYTAYAYDKAGNQTHTSKYIGDQLATTITTYDAFQRPTAQIDALGQQTTLHYNKWTTITTDPSGNRTIVITDPLGRTKARIKITPQGDEIAKDTYTYDNSSQVVEHISTVYIGTRKSHDKHFRLERDKMHRIIALHNDDKVTRTQYTPLGRKSKTIKPDGVVLSWTYDGMGREQTLTSSDGTIHYSYTYDNVGRLLSACNNLTGKVTTRTYNTSGELETETLENELTLTKYYDSQGRVERTLIPGKTGIFYSYDALHLRRISRIDASGNETYHASLTYDLSGNVITQSIPLTANVIHYTHDLLGRPLTATSPLHREILLGYDLRGNILARALDGEKTTYAYDSLDSLIHEGGRWNHYFLTDSHAHRHQDQNTHYTLDIHGSAVSHYTYDANGNPISGGGKEFFYDALDRLISVRTPTTTTHYTYDAFNRRTSKQTGQHLELYLYDGQNDIATIIANKIHHFRLLNPTHSSEIGATLTIEHLGIPHIASHDLFGNIISLHNAALTPIETYTYSAYQHHSPPSLRNPWRYSSKRLDPETDLTYFGRRYYDGRLGRWLTPDPKGLHDGPGLYAYVHCRPLTHHDPYGLATIAEHQATSAPVSFAMEQFVRYMHRSDACLWNSRLEDRYAKASTFLPAKNWSVIGNPDASLAPSNSSLPTAVPIFVPGLFNTPEEVSSNANFLLRTSGASHIVQIHNFTSGPGDVCQAFQTQFSPRTTISETLHNVCSYFRQEYGENTQFLIYGHSNGAAHLSTFINQCTPEQLANIHPRTYCGQNMITKSQSPHAINYASRSDFVPLFFSGYPMHLLKNTWNSRSTKQHIDFHFSPPVAGSSFGDHAFQSERYKRYIKEDFEMIRSRGNLWPGEQ